MNRIVIAFVLLLLGSTAYAQEYKDAKHLALGGPTSFYHPKLTDSTSVRTLGATQGGDIRAVLTASGIPEVYFSVYTTLVNASPAVRGGPCNESTPQDGVLVECDVTPGTTIEWMAHRPNIRKHDPAPQRLLKLRWAGNKSFKAYLFRVTKDRKVYTFIIPKDCGNISLLSELSLPPLVITLPPRPPAPTPEPPAPPVVVPTPPAPEPEPSVVIPPVPTPLPEPESKISFFVDVMGGKDRRTRHADTLVTTDGHAVRPNGVVDDYTQCSPLLGIKFGVAKKFDNLWEVAGTAGVALSAVTDANKVRQNEYFTDLEVNKYTSRDGGFIGTGITFWDVTHKDTWTPGAVVRAGVPAGSHAYIVGEGRVFFDQMNSVAEVRNNYQVWAGLRIH